MNLFPQQVLWFGFLLTAVEGQYLHLDGRNGDRSKVFTQVEVNDYSLDSLLVLRNFSSIVDCARYCVDLETCQIFSILNNQCILSNGTMAPSKGIIYDKSYKATNARCDLPGNIPTNVLVSKLSLLPNGFAEFYCSVSNFMETSTLYSDENCHWNGSYPDCLPCTKWQNHCYFFETKGTIWDLAKDECKSYGGGLTDILSEEENNFVLSQVAGTTPSSDAYWIGARRDSNYDFRWIISGDLLRYTHYYSLEPNGHYTEFCMGMWNHVAGWNFDWGDAKCFYGLGYICKLSIR